MGDPQRFSGRSKEVVEIAKSLHQSGVIPLIHGDRGLGKSSLALQLSRIAQGDVELLEDIGRKDLVLTSEQQMITFYVACEDSTKNLKGLLHLLANAVNGLKHELANEKSDSYKLVDKKTKRGLSLKIFKSETTKKYEVSRKERSLSGLSPSETLVALCETLSEAYGQPVLFIIDELDRLKGVKGLASFLKSNAGPMLRFALVGIGETEGQILKDHQSLDRQLVGVNVPIMKRSELIAIVDHTEAYLLERDLEYSFTPSAKSELARLSSGFPWFVHVIGQQALARAQEEGLMTIQKGMIDRAVLDLAEGRMAGQFYSLYQRAVKDSNLREYVIRLFAEWRNQDIPTSEIYPLATKLGVKNPSIYTGHLGKPIYGAVLTKSPIQGRALYRFKDEMFKVYVRIRGSLYQDVDEEVRKAFSNR
ncbi:AAA family ATPase [Herbiconiux flava]|uniref:ORC1/DEAH AAA+ ATPase domain-containing protein n=1 Tax=Herbiconiux flava TaxID=881268 RepID=A0A852SP10_9MICO|nr:AAA family ATPase [Herbiconiux flava]NYD70559.1 hypothetical protein [Herbiconiux flava]GLK17314.1 DNA-binding protein [Herbiconiux flava]